MADRTPPVLVDDGSDARMRSQAPRKVRAVLTCYVEHVYRRAGEVFVYHGEANPNVYQENPDEEPPVELSPFARSASPGLISASDPTRAADQVTPRKASKASKGSSLID